MAKQSWLVGKLKKMIDQMQGKSAGGVPEPLRLTAADSAVNKAAAAFAFACPACGARFEYPAKFCRYCGAGMSCPAIEEAEAAMPEGADSVMPETAEEFEAAAAKPEEAEEFEEAAEPEGAEEFAAAAQSETEAESASNVVCETERLVLKRMCAEDFDALCVVLKDSEVMYAYEHAFSDEEVQAWLNRQEQRYTENGFGLWLVTLKETKEVIGQCGITLQAAAEKEVMEVGYLFARDHWHKGYAAEAAAACRNYAFETLEAEEVYSIIREGNCASERVAKRNSMVCIGSLVKRYYDMDMPHNLYRITREEWERECNRDACSYELGVIDCFNEMVHAGLKRLAISHPFKTKEERDGCLGFCNKICCQYKTFWYAENEAFLTDLFPERLNKDTYVIIFYRVKEDLDAYLALKKRKEALLTQGRYEGAERYRIAFEFGKLLSYGEEAIYRKICATREKIQD